MIKYFTIIIRNEPLSPMSIRKKIFWSLLSLLLAGMSIGVVLSQLGEMPLRQLWESIQESNKLYLAAAGVCGALFIVLEGEGLRHILSGIGYKTPFRKGVLYSAADIYFSAVTPSATGGQPACALFMLRDDLPTGAVTMTLIVNLILYTISIVLLGLAAVILDWRMFFRFRLVSKILITVGFAILLGLTVFFFLLLRSGKKVFGAIGGLYRFLHRHKIIRLLDARLARLEKAQEDYDQCVRLMREQPVALRKAFCCNFAQRAVRLLVPVLVYLAMGGSVSMAPTILAIQCFVTIGYNCVPVPGGMGVADYLMVDGFAELMGLEDALHVEVLSRSISFYVCVAVSGMIVLVGYLRQRKRERR